MAYTDPTINITTPAGGSQVSAGDDAFRAYKRDMKERVESFFVSIDDDPWVVKPEILEELGAKDDKVMVIPHPSFTGARVDEDSLIYQDDHLQSHDNGGRALYASVILPPGVTVTKIEAIWDKRGNGGIQLEFMRTLISLGTQATLETLPETAAGYTVTESAPLAHVISGLFMYTIKVEPTGAVGGEPIFIYGVRITYNASNFTETL